MVEGVTLKSLNISAYSGDTFHESPLFLQFYRLIIDCLSEWQIGILFIGVDIATAFVLSRVAAHQLTTQVRIDRRRVQSQLLDNDHKSQLASLFIGPDSIDNSAFWVASIYLLSPYSMLSCVGQSTSVFGNCVISVILLASTRGWRLVSMSLLALLTLNSFYPLILLLPCSLILEQKFRLQSADSGDAPSKNSLLIDLSQPSTKCSILLSLVTFLALFASLFAVSLSLEDWSFQFLHSTYAFM